MVSSIIPCEYGAEIVFRLLLLIHLSPEPLKTVGNFPLHEKQLLSVNSFSPKNLAGQSNYWKSMSGSKLDDFGPKCQILGVKIGQNWPKWSIGATGQEFNWEEVSFGLLFYTKEKRNKRPRKRKRGTQKKEKGTQKEE